ncbi:hypothetical protein U9M48_008035 [Paspalum notatum var. saurae]|uniref:Uncharacterized protein n=1 Tax=Paspalum notatum var. saurae TaxID=547442 RepID=A0AAQ3SNY0_PASNO
MSPWIGVNVGICSSGIDNGSPQSVVLSEFLRLLSVIYGTQQSYNARVIVNPNGEINGSITGPIG